MDANVVLQAINATRLILQAAIHHAKELPDEKYTANRLMAVDNDLIELVDQLTRAST